MAKKCISLTPVDFGTLKQCIPEGRSMKTLTHLIHGIARTIPLELRESRGINGETKLNGAGLYDSDFMTIYEGMRGGRRFENIGSASLQVVERYLKVKKYL